MVLLCYNNSVYITKSSSGNNDDDAVLWINNIITEPDNVQVTIWAKIVSHVIVVSGWN